MIDPTDEALAEILEAAGIPRPEPTRQLVQRDTHAVVGPRPRVTFQHDHDQGGWEDFLKGLKPGTITTINGGWS